MVWYNYLPELFHTTWRFIRFGSAHWGASNLWHTRLPRLQQLHFLLQIFCLNCPGSDNFFLLKIWGANAALFAKVLCNIQILCISKIRKFGWKQLLTLLLLWTIHFTLKILSNSHKDIVVCLFVGMLRSNSVTSLFGSQVSGKLVEKKNE